MTTAGEITRRLDAVTAGLITQALADGICPYCGSNPRACGHWPEPRRAGEPVPWPADSSDDYGQPRRYDLDPDEIRPDLY